MLFFEVPYSPELNPDEMANADFKQGVKPRRAKYSPMVRTANWMPKRCSLVDPWPFQYFGLTLRRKLGALAEWDFEQGHPPFAAAP
jgi:hypothetical protein